MTIVPTGRTAARRGEAQSSVMPNGNPDICREAQVNVRPTRASRAMAVSSPASTRPATTYQSTDQPAHMSTTITTTPRRTRRPRRLGRALGADDAVMRVVRPMSGC